MYKNLHLCKEKNLGNAIFSFIIRFKLLVSQMFHMFVQVRVGWM